MRKILFILLLISGAASAQVKQIYNQYGGTWKKFDVRTGLRIPMSTTSTKDYNVVTMDTAQIYYNPSDSSVYVHTGFQWRQVGGAGSTPTLQQVLTAGSTLTTSNTINGGGYDLDFSNNSVFGATAISGSNFGQLQITTDDITIGVVRTGGQSSIDIHPDTLILKPDEGNLRIDSLNYTLSTTGKKILLRDTATGLVQNIDPALLGGGGVTFSSLNSIDTLNKSLNISVWGNSLTEQNPGTPLQLSLLTNRSVYNGGIGGQTSTQIIARFIADTGRRRNITIFEVGRNNYNLREIIKADLATAVAALAAVGNDRYLILSVTNGGGEGIGTAIYDSIISINNDLAAIYGSRYYDVRSALVARYNPTIGADVANHAQDIPPLSLRQDSVHFNWAGYKVWADSVYYNKFTSILNYTKYSDSAISANNAVALFKGRFSNIDVRPGGSFSIGSKDVVYVPNDSTHSPQDYGILSYYYGNGGKFSTGAAIENYSGGYNSLLSVTSGKKNSMNGKDSGKSITTGEGNKGDGYAALFRLQTGDGNSADGRYSQYANISATGVTSVGEYSGYSNETTNYGTFLGSSAGYGSTGTGLSAVGRKSMFQSADLSESNAFGTETITAVHNSGLTRNNAFGNYALFGVGGSDNFGGGSFTQSYFSFFGATGTNNSRVVSLGNYSAYKIYDANNGIYIGHKAQEDTLEGDGAIVIGYDIDAPNKTDDAQGTIGNLIFMKGGFGTGRTIGVGNVGILNNEPTSALHTTSFSSAYVAKTANYTATISDYTIECTANTFTVTLPTAVGITGRLYVVTNSGSGVVTLATTSSQTFVNVVATPTTLTLNQFATVTLQSNGANWLRVTSL